ncbi:MAG: DNA-binding response regulator [Planctomycetaceae bacterium]|nr:DNA-binding response regulator [Planctomycetaceae bacterium]
MTQEPELHRLLLVEDDAPLASMVADFLTPHGFQVGIEGNGDTAVDRITEENPDAVVLDVNLPGRDGFSVCQLVRATYRGPIIMLTARGEEIDEVLGLEAGADDYMSKPVRPRVLLARLRSHLRRSSPADQESKPITVGSLVVDAARRSVEIDGTAVDLTTAEFDLLNLLAKHAGTTLSRNDIHQEIHGMKYDGLDRSIDLRVSRLRKRLGDDPTNPQRIKSVRGVGYMLSLEP